jgi:hypothetical protein
MTRRELLLAAATTSITASTAAASAQDPVALVRAIYEASLQADRQKVGLSEEKLLAPFSLPLRTLWRVARGNPSPSAPIGPKLHAHYGTGVLPGHPVTLDRVTLETATTSHATVAVALTVRGAPRLVRVDLVRENESWRIANFRYPDDDYVAFLKRTMAP